MVSAANTGYRSPTPGKMILVLGLKTLVFLMLYICRRHPYFLNTFRLPIRFKLYHLNLYFGTQRRLRLTLAVFFPFETYL